MRPEPAGPDRRRGSDASLHELYDAVPAAGQLDLHVRLADEAARTHLPPELTAPDDRAITVADAPADPDDVLSEGQALGLLEHVLGAVLVPEDDR